VVDSAPWTAEAEEVFCDEPTRQEDSVDDDDTIRPVIRKPKPKPNIGLGFRPAPAIERETLSESSIPNLHSSLPTLPPRERRDSVESQVSHALPTRRSTMASTRVSPSGSQQPRFSLRQRLSSVNNDLFKHGRGESNHSHHQHHPPLSPTLTSGFQIGLSAVSPGFAIMPVERRAAKQMPRRRRTVSEGDVTRALGDAERLGREMDEREGGADDERMGGADSTTQSGPRWTRFFRGGMSWFKRNDTDA
jgi:magnesium transporter